MFDNIISLRNSNTLDRQKRSACIKTFRSGASSDVATETTPEREKPNKHRSKTRPSCDEDDFPNFFTSAGVPEHNFWKKQPGEDMHRLFF